MLPRDIGSLKPTLEAEVNKDYRFGANFGCPFELSTWPWPVVCRFACGSVFIFCSVLKIFAIVGMFFVTGKEYNCKSFSQISPRTRELF